MFCWAAIPAPALRLIKMPLACLLEFAGAAALDLKSTVKTEGKRRAHYPEDCRDPSSKRCKTRYSQVVSLL